MDGLDLLKARMEAIREASRRRYEALPRWRQWLYRNHEICGVLFLFFLFAGAILGALGVGLEIPLMKRLAGVCAIASIIVPSILIRICGVP